jgi:hypothetical protein
MEDAPTLGFQFAQGPGSPLLANCPVLPILDPSRWRHAGNHEHRYGHAGHEAGAPAQAAPTGSGEVGADDQQSKDRSQEKKRAPVSPKPSLGQVLIHPRCALAGLPGPPRLQHANQHVVVVGVLWLERSIRHGMRAEKPARHPHSETRGRFAEGSRSSPFDDRLKDAEATQARFGWQPK